MNTFDFFAPRPARILALLLFAALLLSSGGARAAHAAPRGGREAASAVSAVNELAIALYRELAEEGANLCFSPYSISTAMAMAYAGARGETAQEMQTALWYKEDAHRANRILREDLMNIPEEAGELAVANSIWPSREFQLSAAFGDVMRTEYATEVVPQDYRRQPDRARRAINAWVEERTRERITDILTPGAVRPDTQMVLVNALYFKAPWMSRFDERRTEDAAFYTSPTETADVRMMNTTDSFEYADFDGAQVLKLPYRQGVFSMLLILPKARDGLSALETALSLDELRWYRMRLQHSRRRVNVFLPKFRAEQTFDLVSPLSALGVKSAFAPGAADFSGIGGKRDLHIDAVVHKAFVEADEAGSEAAAATALTMRTTSAYIGADDVVTFRADHPFLYLIQDDHSGAILFMGKVVKP